MRAPRAILVALLLQPLLACGGEQDSAATAGSIIVSMDDLILFPPDTMLVNIEDILPDSAAGAWVLGSREPFLARVDASGQVLWRAAHRGEGPGEFASPWYLVELRGDSVGVWDVGRRRLVVFDSAGAIRSVISTSLPGGTVLGTIRTQSIGRQLSADRFDDDMLVATLPQGATSAGELRFPLLARVALEGSGGWDTLIDFWADRDSLEAGGDPIQFFTAVPLWAVCGDRVWVYRPHGTGLLTRYRLDGTPDTSRSVSRGGTELTTAERTAVLRRQVESQLPPGAEVPADLNEAIAAMVVEPGVFPSPGPALAMLLCDGVTGDLWGNVFGFDAESPGYGRQWELLWGDAVGTRIEFPAAFRPIRVEGRRFWGSWSDDDGVERVAWYQWK